MARKLTVGARELKTRLGRYIRAVRGGATVVVTERGEPVAELRPLVRRPAIDAQFAALAAAGVVTRGTGEPLPAFDPLPIQGFGASGAIIEGREDRF